MIQNFYPYVFCVTKWSIGMWGYKYIFRDTKAKVLSKIYSTES